MPHPLGSAEHERNKNISSTLYVMYMVWVFHIHVLLVPVKLGVGAWST